MNSANVESNLIMSPIRADCSKQLWGNQTNSCESFFISTSSVSKISLIKSCPSPTFTAKVPHFSVQGGGFNMITPVIVLNERCDTPSNEQTLPAVSSQNEPTGQSENVQRSTVVATACAELLAPQPLTLTPPTSARRSTCVSECTPGTSEPRTPRDVPQKLSVRELTQFFMKEQQRHADVSFSSQRSPFKSNSEGCVRGGKSPTARLFCPSTAKSSPAPGSSCSRNLFESDGSANSSNSINNIRQGFERLFAQEQSSSSTPLRSTTPIRSETPVSAGSSTGSSNIRNNTNVLPEIENITDTNNATGTINKFSWPPQASTTTGHTVQRSRRVLTIVAQFERQSSLGSNRNVNQLRAEWERRAEEALN